MTTTAEAIAADRKFIRNIQKEQGQKAADLKRRVTDKYQLAVKKHNFETTIAQEEAIHKSLRESFDIDEKKLQRILDGGHKFLNAKQQAFTSELVMGHYLAGVNAAQSIIASLEEYEGFINEKIKAKEKWIDTEKFASAKGESVKSLTPREAKRGVLREKLDVFIKSFEPLKALAPKVIQVEDTTPRFDTTEELDEQIQILEEELKID